MAPKLGRSESSLWLAAFVVAFVVQFQDHFNAEPQRSLRIAEKDHKP